MLNTYEKIAMVLDLKKGDTILTGRFKNHPEEVKSFGVDAKNQPTINDRTALNFRIKKLMPTNEEPKEKTVNKSAVQRLAEYNTGKSPDKKASVFPWFMTAGGALTGGAAGALLGSEIGRNSGNFYNRRRNANIGALSGGILGALGGGYAGYKLAPAFGLEESFGAGARVGDYGDVLRRGALLGVASGFATGALSGGFDQALRSGAAGIPVGMGIGAVTRYFADRSYGSTPGTRRIVRNGQFFGEAPKLSYNVYGNPYIDKTALLKPSVLIPRHLAEDLYAELIKHHEHYPTLEEAREHYRSLKAMAQQEDKRSSAFPFFSTLTGAGLGGVAGAGIGAHLPSSRWDMRRRKRNMLLGGLMGAGLGGVGGYYAAPFGRMEESLLAPVMVGTPADAVARGVLTGGLPGGFRNAMQRYAGDFYIRR